MDYVEIELEVFNMQRAYLLALTIRQDIPQKVKDFIQSIEMALAEDAGVKSFFKQELKIGE